MSNVSCPICQREMTGERDGWPYFPFCGKRCKLIDLGRWLDGRYWPPPRGDDDTERRDEESELS